MQTRTKDHVDTEGKTHDITPEASPTKKEMIEKKQTLQEEIITEGKKKRGRKAATSPKSPKKVVGRAKKTKVTDKEMVEEASKTIEKTHIVEETKVDFPVEEQADRNPDAAKEGESDEKKIEENATSELKDAVQIFEESMMQPKPSSFTDSSQSLNTSESQTIST